MMNWAPLLPSTVGGLIGGGFAILATFATYWHNSNLLKKQKRSRVNGILRAIKYEFELLGQEFQKKAGDLLDKLEDGKPYNVYFLLTQDYFIIYPRNTEVVGQIDDAQLCKAIVVTYNKANLFIEALRVNNWHLEKLSEFQKMNVGILQGDIERLRQTLIAAAPQLKEAHRDLKHQTEG